MDKTVKPNPRPSRRNFIFSLAKTLIAANATVYVLGTVSKALDGSLVAGAKTWRPYDATSANNPGCMDAPFPQPYGQACSVEEFRDTCDGRLIECR